MEPIVVYERRISWHDWRKIGLHPIDLAATGAGRYWVEFCRRYAEIRAHFYDDCTLVQLVERRGQIRIPAVVPYNQIVLEHKDRRIRIRMMYPDEYIVLPVEEKDFRVGDLNTLAITINNGSEREENRSLARGFESKPYYFE